MSFSSTRMSHFQIRKTYHFQIRKLCLLQIRKCVHFKYENVSLLNTRNVSFSNTRMCHFQIRKTHCGLYVFSNTNVTYLSTNGTPYISMSASRTEGKLKPNVQYFLASFFFCIFLLFMLIQQSVFVV